MRVDNRLELTWGADVELHAPSSQPAQHAPSSQPAQHAPCSQPALHVPSSQPALHVPSSQPALHVPSSQPALPPSQPWCVSPTCALSCQRVPVATALH